MALTKIVSGGQTGVDRGALDAALAAVLFGASCLTPRIGSGPPGRAFVGASRRGPERYPLTPLPGGGYRQRTRQNVIDSDGTAILFYESLSGGTKLTRDSCVREKKPFVVLDAKLISESAAAAAIVRFVEENEIQVLNVAGPRASGWVAGYRFALDVVSGVIRDVGSIDFAAVRTP
jgi:hypothetical protein